MANNISIADGKTASNLQVLFSKMKNVYYSASAITKASIAAGVECALEFPVLSDGVTLNTGTAEVTEVKLTTGSIWTSRAEKGDSDISFQVASIATDVNELFLTEKTAAEIDTGVTFGAEMGLTGTFTGKSYSLDVNKVTGALVMTDDNKQTVIILTNVDMYGAFVAADGDNPAYFNVTVTPKDNTDGAGIIILQKN